MVKKNKPNRGIIAGVIVLSIVLFLSILQLAGIVQLFGQETYETGLNLDTTADFYEHVKNYDPWKGQAWLKGVGEEAVKGDVEIVSWQEGVSSSKIVSRCDFQYHARARCEGWLCAFGYLAGVCLGRYWIKVTLIDSTGQESVIINTQNNWFDSSKVELIQGPKASDYAGVGKGHYLPNTQLLKYVDGSEIDDDLAGTEWMVPWQEQDGEAQWYPLSTADLVFKLKDNTIGGLRYDAAIEYLERENFDFGWTWHQGTALICSDEIYLAGGIGEITVESTNSIGNDGTETTPETNKVYTKYVYEEGSEVTFKVNAGYSGASLDPDDALYGKGWSFEIYNSRGLQQYQQSIPDGIHNYPVTYTVPDGAFIPNDPYDNEWSVVLKNTAFEQAETRLFVIDEYEKMPGQTTITTDKQRYVQWETVYITLTANANADTGLPIQKFTAFAKYGSASSVDYAMTSTDFTASSIGGGAYTASFSFQLTKGNKNVYIRAHAIDIEGRAGPEGEWNIFSEQAVGNYEVTVTVKDEFGSPIANAIAEMGTTSVNTNPQGVAKIYINYGTYSLKVSKAGYTTYTKSGISIQSDTDIDVQLKSTSFGLDTIYYIIIAIIIVVAFVIFWYYYKKRSLLQGKRKKKFTLFKKR